MSEETNSETLKRFRALAEDVLKSDRFDANAKEAWRQKLDGLAEQASRADQAREEIREAIRNGGFSKGKLPGPYTGPQETPRSGFSMPPRSVMLGCALVGGLVLAGYALHRTIAARREKSFVERLRREREAQMQQDVAPVR